MWSHISQMCNSNQNSYERKFSDCLDQFIFFHAYIGIYVHNFFFLLHITYYMYVYVKNKITIKYKEWVRVSDTEVC